MPEARTPQRRLTFRLKGRYEHLEIIDAADLAASLELDQALWVATSAPIAALRLDPVLAGLFDRDGDGRIRAAELRTTLQWLLAALARHDRVTQAVDGLQRADLNVDHPAGRNLANAITAIASRLGQAESEPLVLEQVRRLKKQIESAGVSESGVILPASVEDPTLRTFLEDVRAAEGGVSHPTGPHGVNQASLNQFRQKVGACLAWRAEAEPSSDGSPATPSASPGEGVSTVTPLGERTAEAADLVSSVRERVDRFFALCDAVAWDASLAGLLDSRAAAWPELADAQAPAIRERLAGEPIQRPDPAKRLRFDQPINPAHADVIDRLRREVLTAVLGESDHEPPAEMSSDDWRRVIAVFEPHWAWRQRRPAEPVATLDAEKLRRYAESDLYDQAGRLIEESPFVAVQMDQVRLVEQAILLQMHALSLANNFISMPDLYALGRPCRFEMGELVMDGRWFRLAVRVDNRAEHAAQVQLGRLCVLYLTLSGQNATTPIEVAVPVTAGGRGNLAVGKRGVFIDVDGLQWDARVTQIVENPISLMEATLAPFVRIGAMITGKIDQLTGAAEKQLDLATQQTLTSVETSLAPTTDGATPTPPAPAAAPAPVATPAPGSAPPSWQTRGLMAGGVLAAGGVAVAALGSAFAYITAVLQGVAPAVILGGVIGAVFAFLAPATLLALIRLRQRDLSALLEGSGWAINARMRLTRRQSLHFTDRPRRPARSQVRRPISWWVTRGLWLLLLAMLITFALVRYYSLG